MFVNKLMSKGQTESVHIISVSMQKFVKKKNNNNICGCMQNNFESIITNNLAHEMKKNNFLTFI